MSLQAASRRRFAATATTSSPARCRTLSSTPTASQPSNITAEAKRRLRSIMEEKKQGSRSMSATGNAAAAEARPKPAPTFQQTPPMRFPTPSPAPLTPSPHKRIEIMDSSFIGMSGGQIFHEMMLRHNVKHVFGYPGGAILPVFDAIHNSPHFDFILPRHEQGAGHMAEGYARASGKVGVVLVTSGPGATNTITPMQDALSDGTPMVVFCGQVATSAIGSDAFQEADVIGISRSCTKWNVMVKDIAELPRRINEAFKIASSGRPGPVLVDLPKDITAGILRTPIPLRYTQPELAEENLPVNPLGRQGLARRQQAPVRARQSEPQPTEHPPPDMPMLQKAAKLIAGAKRPVIYAGQGMLHSENGPALLKQLVEKGNIPVTTTLLGMGAFDEEDPKSLHMLGMHGSAYANLAMQEADVIIALGARFDDRVTGKIDLFAPQARAAALQGRGGIIHFEIQPKNINKVVQATCPIEGDVSHNLSHLLALLPETAPQRADWFDTIARWKTEYPFIYEKSQPGGIIKPQEVIEALHSWCKAEPERKEKTIVSTGVGQHQMWAAQHFRWTEPRSIVTSGGLGTMGFGLPAAIGAKVAAPDSYVVDIDGDASLSMTMMELATAHEFNIGVKVIVLDNAFQGMVLQWQDLFYESRYASTRMTNPDFAKLAEAMHCKAIYCDKIEELPDKMAEFMEYDNSRPVLLHVKVTDREHCYPMVQAGKALHEQLLHPLLRKSP